MQVVQVANAVYMGVLSIGLKCDMNYDLALVQKLFKKEEVGGVGALNGGLTLVPGLATRSMAPPMPLTILPGIIQLARSPFAETCMAPRMVTSMCPPLIMANDSQLEKNDPPGRIDTCTESKEKSNMVRARWFCELVRHYRASGVRSDDNINTRA